ncbi:MAG: hypothetical protein ACE5IZ_08290 [Dehalococcoidia bacterium]
MTMPQLRSQRYEVESLHEAIEFYYERGWTDGLPVVPPTEEQVRQFLAAAGLDPETVLGYQPTRRRTVIAEKAAINAVMAGCRPDYMPVVAAAIRAVLEDEFTLHGCGSSTAGAAVLLVVNGPIRRQLEMNALINLFGPGWRANATIGRAVRLVLINVLGFRPGVLDMGTLGHPGRYTYCIAEDEENSPWEPLHVERGLPAEASAVTAFAAEPPHQVVNETANSPEAILDSVATTLRDVGNLSNPAAGQYAIVIAGQHRSHMARAGCGKRQVREYLFERAQVTKEDFERAGKVLPPRLRRSRKTSFPVVARPDDFLVIAAGGHAGGYSAVVPPWLGKTSYAVTKPVSM